MGNLLFAAKPYKACKPLDTIIKIKNILSRLEIYLKEEHFPHGDFYACSVIAANDGLDGIELRTNGKGMNMQYAFASAHAEFMERLQNYFLFKDTKYASKLNLNTIPDGAFKKRLCNEDLVLDFQYDPKEIFLPTEKLIESNLEEMKSIFLESSPEKILSFVKKDLGILKTLCIPFYNYFRKEEEYLPYNFILSTCATNGMCAGNTPKEAILQGISEIFERYAAKEIYQKRLTPPTIPHEEFKATKSYQLIKSLESNGLKIIIKDCSLNIGLPVIGVIVIEPKGHKYNFQLGSDPIPYIALERCLTELHQNPSGIVYSDIKIGNGPKYEVPGYEYKDLDYLNNDKILCFGIGEWPSSIFFSEPTYKYLGLDYSFGQNDENDFKNYTKILSNLGKKLYIRDVSFLGFHSYYVYIPGMSELRFDKSNFLIFKDYADISDTLRDLKGASDKKLKELATVLDKRYELFLFCNKKYQSKFIYNNNIDIKELDLELLLVMLFYKIRDYIKALSYMEKFLMDKKPENYLYFVCIKDYLSLKVQGMEKEEIIKVLSTLYDSSLVSEVIEDLDNPDEILKYHNLPSCFNCGKCEIVNNCKYFEIIRIVKRLQEQHKANYIQQINLKNILN